MHVELAEQTEPPPTKVEGFSGLEFLRRTVGPFRTAVGGLKPDFWKLNCLYEWLRAKLCFLGVGETMLGTATKQACLPSD